jgi:peptidoglycan hydrolase-like protein with peptidoglycan-binding domain
MATGKLQIQVTSELRATPVEDAVIDISSTGEPDQILEEVKTDRVGQTDTLELEAPPEEYSLSPGEMQPYSEYNFRITAPGYEPLTISGAEILANQLALQDIRLKPVIESEDYENIVIPAHTLYGDYPPKIAEAEIKPVSQSGEIVLSRVVVPEFVVVHDGAPTDNTASDYYVRYRDYIKNVASSEIYATWPKAAIRANVLAIMSFTLNRVYTEWYRNKGFDFTITSSTAFDHKWIYGRNIFESISEVVDELFADYLSRPNVKQPILTQYCDGKRVTCPNWLSQWGSKSLADQGYTTTEILRYYYGDNLYINTAEEISGIPASWPGYDLDIGATGPKVEQMQEQLNAISNNYPLIPRIAVDGIYGEATQKAVEVFQDIFNLPVTGIVDYRTWYKIQEIYVGVTRIAELR